MFLLGLALGLLVAAGIGWLFWNKKAKLQAEYDALVAKIPRG